MIFCSAAIEYSLSLVTLSLMPIKALLSQIVLIHKMTVCVSVYMCVRTYIWYRSGTFGLF